jgi:hypothetical protein
MAVQVRFDQRWNLEGFVLDQGVSELVLLRYFLRHGLQNCSINIVKLDTNE